jgi:glutathione S-transferase
MPCLLHVDSLYASPWAMSVFVALSEKGLPFTVATVDLAAGQQYGSAFAGRVLTGRVPALDMDGFTLTESTAITEYLEECFPAPAYQALYPHDRRQRAQARQIQGWVRTDLAAVRQERDTETLFWARPARLSRRPAMPPLPNWSMWRRSWCTVPTCLATGRSPMSICPSC